MTEKHDIHQIVADRADGGGFAVAVVLKAEGSTPRSAGTKAIVEADGTILGTIGGGIVEAEAQRRAVEAIRTQRPLVFDFGLEGDSARQPVPICGGRMRVLVDPTASRCRSSYAAAARARRRRERGVLLTIVRGTGALATAVEHRPEGSLAQDLPRPSSSSEVPAVQPLSMEVLRAGRSALVRNQPEWLVLEGGERMEILVEPLVPQPLLVIAGGGHVGQAVAAQASAVGFDILVIDDRPEFSRALTLPEGASARCGAIGEELASLPLGDDAYVVIVTRGHEKDAEALAACLHRPAAYLGMIGSRRKAALMRKDFLESGRATAEELDRVYAPIGLEIGAVTVPEIATSIVAQLISVRRGKTAPRWAVWK